MMQMQFKSIKLENFQSHIETTVQFAPGITTIVGPSDHGKSAILRALKWVCLNDIDGDGFITEGEKTCSVALTTDQLVDNDHEINRSKGTKFSLNTYALDGKVFKSFNTNVPAEIENTLHVNDINFQCQHDSPFWFAESAAEVSRQLNAVVDLSIIDSTLTNIAASVSEAKQKKKICDERLTAYRLEYEAIKPHGGRIADYNALVAAADRAAEAQQDHDRLAVILEGIDTSPANYLAKRANELCDLLGLATIARESDYQRFALDDIIQQWDQFEYFIAPPSFVSLETKFKALKEAEESRDELMVSIFGLEHAEKQVAGKRDVLQVALENFTTKTKGIKCPLCGK